jgi:hypothetical protein
VWLLSNGLKCAEHLGEPAAILRFTELVELFNDLTTDARFLSEDVYRIAAERRCAGNSENGGTHNAEAQAEP